MPYHGFVAPLLLVMCCGGAQALADSPSGGFFSSLKQAIKQGFDKEVVRGHFDVGSVPDMHRYYCLVDPKTGRREPNGVAGQPVLRPDGTTGIKEAVVSFSSCADAESKGILVTTGYVLGTDSGADSSARSSQASPAAAAPSPPAAAAATAPTATDASAQAAIQAVYARFIEGQNAHDRAIVAGVLLDSKDFVLVTADEGPIWGLSGALAAFELEWRKNSAWDPPAKEMRVALLTPDAAVLTTPQRFARGDPAKPSPVSPQMIWSGVFVKTSAGWRISSIFVAARSDAR